MQSGQNAYHRHALNVSGAIASEKKLEGNFAITKQPGTTIWYGAMTNDCASAVYFGAYSGQGAPGYTYKINATHSHSLAGNTGYNGSSTTTENRPANYTIRIWKRTT